MSRQPITTEINNYKQMLENSAETSAWIYSCLYQKGYM